VRRECAGAGGGGDGAAAAALAERVLAFRANECGRRGAVPAPARRPDAMSAAWAFGFFFVSGLCSLVYEVVWLRLAMASFGVTTAFVSIVLSVFMAGLALGSWGAGRVTARSTPGGARTFLRFYAAAELVVAVSGIL